MLVNVSEIERENNTTKQTYLLTDKKVGQINMDENYTHKIGYLHATSNTPGYLTPSADQNDVQDYDGDYSEPVQAIKQIQMISHPQRQILKPVAVPRYLSSVKDSSRNPISDGNLVNLHRGNSSTKQDKFHQNPVRSKHHEADIDQNLSDDTDTPATLPYKENTYFNPYEFHSQQEIYEKPRIDYNNQYTEARILPSPPRGNRSDKPDVNRKYKTPSDGDEHEYDRPQSNTWTKSKREGKKKSNVVSCCM